MDQRRSGRNVNTGYRFLINMKPSSKLPMVLYFRPSRAQTYSFVMPFTLHSGPTAAISSMATNSSTSKCSNRVSSAVGGLPVARCAGGATSLSGGAVSTLLENISERAAVPMVVARSSEDIGPGQLLGAGTVSALLAEKVSAAALEECEPGAGPVAEVLAVPVTATGLQPQLILSKTVVEFGSKVIQQQGKHKKPYVQDIYIRNNTSAQLEVSSLLFYCSYPAWQSSPALLSTPLVCSFL